MTIYRARFFTDLLYEADKPMSGALLTRVSNRIGTYTRTGAVEGLEDKVDVKFDEGLRRQQAHHHDARYEKCVVELHAAQDELGPIE